MEIVESILTNNPCYKTGRKIGVKGLMLHSVGCPQPSAEVFVRNWNKPESSRACVHAFIDADTGTVYQTLPWNHMGWHSGGVANGTHIGVEMCEPACIKYTGGASFTCYDRQKALEAVRRTYEAAVELFAFLCKQYGLNPLLDGVVISHKEGYDRGVASGHADPDHLWKGLDCGYTMNTFRQDVFLAMGNVNMLQIHNDGQKEPKEIAPDRIKNEEITNKEIINENDIVTLTKDASYYTGKAIPEWVLNDRWIVKSVNGDRVVIDKNVSGTKAICSPVALKYIRKESVK